MTFAAMLLFFRNETGFGGNNGFTDFKRILDIPMAARPPCAVTLFVLTGVTLLGWLSVRHAGSITRSKFGRVFSPPCAMPSHARDVQRLQPFGLQAVYLDHFGGDVRRGRGALVCAAGGHHQPVARCRPANSIEIAIWAGGGWACHAGWGRCWVPF
jgi:urea transport system permease protein